MKEKVLGKIQSAHIGFNRDCPYLYGLFITFSLDGGTSGISCDRIIANVNRNNEADDVQIQERKVTEVLKDAKVNYIDELVNIPVEVTIENNIFKSFRVLTEVL